MPDKKSFTYPAAERFSTQLLDEALESEKIKREELRLQLIERLFGALHKLHRTIAFHEAYLFGSITRPYKFSKDSDIDIGFTGLKDEDFFKAMAFISGELGRDVDVVQLERHRFAEKIKKEGIKWTGKA